MSWNLNVIGSRAAVAAAVDANQYIPPGLKTAIKEVVLDVSQYTTKGVHVETYGHFGGGCSSISKLRIDNVEIAPEPAVAAPATPTPPGS